MINTAIIVVFQKTSRSATITVKEDNTHFLRVDKDNYNKIVRDIEANTVRLKEQGSDVLVLEKSPRLQKYGILRRPFKSKTMTTINIIVCALRVLPALVDFLPRLARLRVLLTVRPIYTRDELLFHHENGLVSRPQIVS